jgi:hypothetical protein
VSFPKRKTRKQADQNQTRGSPFTIVPDTGASLAKFAKGDGLICLNGPLGRGQQAAAINRMQIKTNYQTLDMLGDEMRAKVRPDDSGDRSITGKLGDIVEGTLHGARGYYVSLMYAGARKLSEVLKAFGCARVTQRGDSEAVVFISHDNAISRAEDLRVAINARKRPTLTVEQRAWKAVRVLQVRPTPDHLVGLAAQEPFVLAGHAGAFL